MSCSCKVGCANKRCLCLRQGSSSTDSCKCSKACRNKGYQIVDIANDDDEDDGNDDNDNSVDAGDQTDDVLYMDWPSAWPVNVVILLLKK